MNSQPKLGEKGLIGFIAFLTTITPITIDMFLPALPEMTKHFNTTNDITSLTISLFFLFYAIGMLFWGPISDKYGRKAPLRYGLVLYLIGSLLGCFATSIYFLIFTRIIQAIGVASMPVITTAIIKDSFEDKKRETALSFVQTLFMIGPIIAPVLGGIILKFFSWQVIFISFNVLAVGSLILTHLFTETLPPKKRLRSQVINSFSRLYTVIKNPKFAVLLMIFSLLALPFFTYLSQSSFIYQNTFELDKQQFSYFYALTAMISTPGPFSYLFLSKIISRTKIIAVCFLLITTCGLIMLKLGTTSAIAFAAIIALNNFTGALIRTPGVNLMLSQQKKHAGAASSLISFSGIMAGCLGMGLAFILPINDIKLIALELFVIGGIASAAWIYISKKKFIS